MEEQEQDNPWTTQWNDHYKAPFMFKGLKWVSYDNIESIRIKSQYAYDLNLAGVMTWSIDTDDFRGLCGGPKFPLLRTINNALYEREQGITGGAAGRAGVASALVLSVLSALFAAIML